MRKKSIEEFLRANCAGWLALVSMAIVLTNTLGCSNSKEELELLERRTGELESNITELETSLRGCESEIDDKNQAIQQLRVVEIPDLPNLDPEQIQSQILLSVPSEYQEEISLQLQHLFVAVGEDFRELENLNRELRSDAKSLRSETNRLRGEVTTLTTKISLLETQVTGVRQDTEETTDILRERMAYMASVESLSRNVDDTIEVVRDWDAENVDNPGFMKNMKCKKLTNGVRNVHREIVDKLEDLKDQFTEELSGRG